MLDDSKVVEQRDRENILGSLVESALQEASPYRLDDIDHDDREIHHIVVACMGGSALAADIARELMIDTLHVPYEVVRGYDIPAYVGEHSLVIACSFSGNTEETVACLHSAIDRGSQIAVIATGGVIQEIAKEHHILHATLVKQPLSRLGVFAMIRAIVEIVTLFELSNRSILDSVIDANHWLRREAALWLKQVPTERNYAKQLALQAVGKTPVFYASNQFAPVAHTWKVGWNENAKNIAFSSTIPEALHNEFTGWTSHPIDKPFAVFDIVSNHDSEKVQRRFALSDQLLSGLRPKSTIIPLAGDTSVQQILWGCLLANFVSVYVGILNNVNPADERIVQKLKQALTEDNR